MKKTYKDYAEGIMSAEVLRRKLISNAANAEKRQLVIVLPSEVGKTVELTKCKSVTTKVEGIKRLIKTLNGKAKGES